MFANTLMDILESGEFWDAFPGMKAGASRRFWWRRPTAHRLRRWDGRHWWSKSLCGARPVV